MPTHRGLICTALLSLVARPKVLEKIHISETICLTAIEFGMVMDMDDTLVIFKGQGRRSKVKMYFTVFSLVALC